LSRHFQGLAKLDVAKVCRVGASATLIDESRRVPDLRNDVIHKGQAYDEAGAENAFDVAVDLPPGLTPRKAGSPA
jgi:hypothetical protein